MPSLVVAERHGDHWRSVVDVGRYWITEDDTRSLTISFAPESIAVTAGVLWEDDSHRSYETYPVGHPTYRDSVIGLPSVPRTSKAVSVLLRTGQVLLAVWAGDFTSMVAALAWYYEQLT
jgi:hypothetical protein